MTLRDVLLDPEVFESPQEFLPDRWLSDKRTTGCLNQGYVPFGRGSRMCVGLK